MEQRKHILWDWNGTLLDDTQLCCDIANELILHYDKREITKEEYRSVFQFPISEYYKTIGLPHKGHEFETAGAYFIQEYDKRKFNTRMHNEVHKTLGKLGMANWDQSVLSAYEQVKLDELVDYHGMSDIISHCLGTDNDFALGKIQRGCEFINSHGGSADTWILVGDTLHDVEVAQAMEISCCLVDFGHNSPEVLKSAGAPVFSTFEALSIYLLEQA